MTKNTTMKLLAIAALPALMLTVSGAAPERAPAPPALVAAEIKDAAFSPARIEVERGATVEWTNRDPMQHSVMARDSSFDSGLLDPSRTFRHTFDAAGTYELFCGPHPFMRVTVVVR
jgi:plastocyanin